MELHPLRNILRLNRIVTILIKYGFGGLVRELHLFPYLSFLERVLIRRAGKGLTIPERIRLVLVELGPTFTKLGQVASTRADILPFEWIEELKKLQDMVPPFPFDKVRKVTEGSLKKPLEEAYGTFEEVPVASASIAQVHLATLPDGTEVAVKVKRPHIDRTIDADISVMYTVAELLQRYVPGARRFRPKEVVDEFSRAIHREQDLSIEGANITTFVRMFKGDPEVQIPGVIWDLTTPEVLTMERISGTPIDEIEALKEKGFDVKEIAVRALKSFFKQVFEYGVFHADQHPGNIFVRDDGVIIYLDFGIVGRLTRELRHFLASMLYYLVRQDYYRMALLHKQMGLIGREVDIYEFEEALRDITEPVFGKTLEQINISTLLMRLIRTAREFQVRLQPSLLLLEKTMVIVEGIGRQLHPNINMFEVAKPLIYKWMIREKFSPRAVYEKGREYTDELAETIIDLPGQVHTLMDRAVEDELKIGFVHYRLETVADELARAGRRISTGIIVAALLVGASIVSVFSSANTTRLFGLPTLSAVGFVLALVLGLRLFTGRRRGKRDGDSGR
jgi:ubiquinone biosynthesis protein